MTIAFWAVNPSESRADDPPRAEGEERDGTPRHYGNLRIGASTANENRRPELCLELVPLQFLSVEACGTGSGFLHRDPEAEVAHFIAKLRLAAIETPYGSFQPHVSLGFAELQVAADDPGFRFSSTGDRGVETAGPEVGLSLRWLIPIGSGFEAVFETRMAIAYLPEATRLVRPFPAFLPFASVTLGVGW